MTPSGHPGKTPKRNYPKQDEKPPAKEAARQNPIGEHKHEPPPRLPNEHRQLSPHHESKKKGKGSGGTK